MKSKDITLAAVLAALYIGIGLVIPFVSFGAIQCRLSDALYPLIAVLGTPALIGLTVGHFIYNLYGYSTGFALGILNIEALLRQVGLRSINSPENLLNANRLALTKLRC